jgi:hypothetical protein
VDDFGAPPALNASGGSPPVTSVVDWTLIRLKKRGVRRNSVMELFGRLSFAMGRGV